MPSLRSLKPSVRYSVITISCVVAVLLLLYLTPILSQSQRAYMAYHFGDFLFLSLIIIFIGIRFFNAKKDRFDHLFWLLFGGAFLSWWLLTLVFLTTWTELSKPTQNLISGISYFLFYALTIAAIELKSYRQANQLLSIHSSIIWLATLSFTLGAFIFLVIIPSTTTNGSVHSWPTTYLFYFLMDAYISARWFFLAYSTRNAKPQGYLLLGLAMTNWLIADLVEATNHFTAFSLNSGGWIDWLWFTPYLFITLALTQSFKNLQSASVNRDFSRFNLLNSPLTFIILILATYALTTQNTLLKGQLTNTHYSMFTGWLLLSVILALGQLYLLIKQTAMLRFRLKESEFASTTFKQQLEQQAKKIEQQRDSYRSTLESINNAIFTTNENGQIQSANSAASRLLEHSHEKLLTMNFSELVEHDSDLALFFRFQSYRQKLVRQNAGIEMEANVLNADGEAISVHVTLSKGISGSESAYVIALADIREQKQAEQEIMRMKDEFTANISHEFRTPLTIINGVLDNLKSHLQDPASLNQIETAKNNGLRMVRMVEQLLELSRSNRHSILLSAIDVGQTLTFVAKSFAPIAREKNIQFNFPDSAHFWAMGNLQAAEKIIFNLLSNAFKYTPKDGQVTLSIEQHNERLLINVSDTGVGIDPAEQSKIFQRFYRTEDTHGKQIHGVGIGLALVKELCFAMGWSIQLNSALGQGATFTLTLQATQAALEPVQLEVPPAQPIEYNIESELLDAKATSPQRSAHKSKYLVLVIEDNLDMQQHLLSIIGAEHQCIVAENGEEGVKMAIEYLPDIIISDVMMPVMDGFEALKVMRRNELTAHIPVIMLTARSDAESRKEGLKAAADDYLSKPFDAEELLLRLRNQIQSRLKLAERLRQQLGNERRDTIETMASPAIEDKFLIRLNACFEAFYDDADISMTMLASELAMSERQLQRKVKALLDLSPLEALKTFRVEKAKQLLKKQEPVGVVAQKVGFSSQSHFGRIFKEQLGMTPGQYQKQHKKSASN
ncbi:MAG: response regulator [Gammaproteobacteria bacterium]|nr:response regulator [Gammaproteobacteria bacterium]